MPRGVSVYDEAWLQGRLWTPRVIPSLVAWWDAQQGITASGGSVSAWTDVIQSITATQATGSAQPTYSVTARNSKPGLIFNGSKLLNFTPTALPSASPLTLAVAERNDGTGAFGGNDYVFYYGTTTQVSNQGLGVGEAQTGASVAFGAPGAGVNPSLASAYADRFLIGDSISGQTNGSNVYVDGALLGTGTITYTLPQTAGYIGGRYGASWGGVIQQILVFKAILTLKQRQSLEGWESHYNGKRGSNLPASHPFKNRPPLIGD